MVSAQRAPAGKASLILRMPGLLRLHLGYPQLRSQIRIYFPALLSHDIGAASNICNSADCTKQPTAKPAHLCMQQYRDSVLHQRK